MLAEVDGQPARPGQGETPHFELHKKGSFTGSTGCNRLNGTYIASEGALQFTPGAMTMKACADPVMQQEQAVLAAIKATTAYKIDGNTLEFKNGDKVLAKFDAEGKSGKPVAIPLSIHQEIRFVILSGGARAFAHRSRRICVGLQRHDRLFPFSRKSPKPGSSLQSEQSSYRAPIP